jgi:beta-lactamase superfamily II metal-dependent hydrolase
MTDQRVRVQMYNVGFGDCFLVTVTGATRKHRILFDCGRHAGSRPTAEGERTFEEVVAGLIDDLATDAPDGQPWLDVIVVTHRHRDHVHGFRYKDLWKRVNVKEVWMPWVEDPQNPTAQALVASQEKAALRTLFMLRALKASGKVENTDEAIDVIHNSTANPEAMATLRAGFANQPKLRYLPRQAREPDVLNVDELRDVMPDDVVVHVLGPSRDPKVIRRLNPPEDKVYERIIPNDAAFRLDIENGELPDRKGVDALPRPFDTSWSADAIPADDGDVTAAYRMAESSSESPLAAAFRVDNALNGTSLVLLVQVGEYKLLFPGDAQWGTWNAMLTNPETKALLTGVDVYKVGHHGSHNATPIEFVTDCLIAKPTTTALISVDETNYGGGWKDIPLTTLVTALKEKATVKQSNHTSNAVVAGIAIAASGKPDEVTLP